METFYNLPDGFIKVVDTVTAGGALAEAVESWQEGSVGALFFGRAGRPEGVAISFGQWTAYVGIGQETRYERRVVGLTPEQLGVGERASETICKMGNGLSVRVIDTAAAGRALAAAVRCWSEARNEPLFCGAGADPEGAVISFAEWAALEELTDIPARYVLFDDLLREWDLQEPEDGSEP